MIVLIATLILVITVPFCNAYSYGINDLLKELDVPEWREKIRDERFLSKFNDEDRFEIVVALADARGYDWRYRIRAIRMLGYLKTDRARDALIKMFQDPFFHHECPSLKLYVAEALGDYKGDIRLLDVLKEGLNDKEVLVREATAKSLGTIGMPEAAQYLIEAFRREKSLAVKIAIVNSLRLINTSEAQSFLNQISKEESEKELLDAFGGSF